MAIIEVTIRYPNAGAGIKEYAEERANKLVRQFPRVESVHVVIDKQRQLYEADFIVQTRGQTAVGAKELSDNLRSVIDTAAARAEKQLRKTIKKRVTAPRRKKTSKDNVAATK